MNGYQDNSFLYTDENLNKKIANASNFNEPASRNSQHEIESQRPLKFNSRVSQQNHSSNIQDETAYRNLYFDYDQQLKQFTEGHVQNGSGDLYNRDAKAYTQYYGNIANSSGFNNIHLSKNTERLGNTNDTINMNMGYRATHYGNSMNPIQNKQYTEQQVLRSNTDEYNYRMYDDHNHYSLNQSGQNESAVSSMVSATRSENEEQKYYRDHNLQRLNSSSNSINNRLNFDHNKQILNKQNYTPMSDAPDIEMESFSPVKRNNHFNTHNIPKYQSTKSNQRDSNDMNYQRESHSTTNNSSPYRFSSSANNNNHYYDKKNGFNVYQNEHGQFFVLDASAQAVFLDSNPEYFKTLVGANNSVVTNTAQIRNTMNNNNMSSNHHREYVIGMEHDRMYRDNRYSPSKGVHVEDKDGVYEYENNEEEDVYEEDEDDDFADYNQRLQLYQNEFQDSSTISDNVVSMGKYHEKFPVNQGTLANPINPSFVSQMQVLQNYLYSFDGKALTEKQNQEAMHKYLINTAERARPQTKMSKYFRKLINIHRGNHQEKNHHTNTFSNGSNSKAPNEPLVYEKKTISSIKSPTTVGSAKKGLNASEIGVPMASPSPNLSVTSPVSSISTSVPFTSSNLHDPVSKENKARGRKPAKIGGENALKCPYCVEEKECFFKRKEHLKRHINSVHFKAKPFLCEICKKKSFTRNDNMKHHMTICKGENKQTSIK